MEGQENKPDRDARAILYAQGHRSTDSPTLKSKHWLAQFLALFGWKLALTMLTTPSMAYHDAFRFVCSLRLYHICTTATNVGARRGENNG